MAMTAHISIFLNKNFSTFNTWLFSKLKARYSIKIDKQLVRL